MISMENFYNWLSKKIPDSDVNVWFNLNNVHYDKVMLFKDIFKSLNTIILDTYLGFNEGETSISMSHDDKFNHFEWCWNKLVVNFINEKIKINLKGDHKEYFLNFYFDLFYESNDTYRISIDEYIDDLFNLDKSFTKADLDILTDLYLLLDKNIEWGVNKTLTVK